MNEETGSDNVDLTDFSQAGEGDAVAADEPQATPEPMPRASDDAQRSASDLEAVFDIPVNIAAVLGRTNMEVSELLHLDSGDVIELDRKVGEAIDIYVNNRLVARGEVVLVDDKLGITMTEIIKADKTG